MKIIKKVVLILVIIGTIFIVVMSINSFWNWVYRECSRWERYEIESKQRDDEQDKATRIAYYQSLLATPYGRQVYADMLRRARELDALVKVDKGYAIAVLLLDDFMRETRRLCGITNEMPVIEAEQIIAQASKVEVAEPDHPPEFRV